MKYEEHIAQKIENKSDLSIAGSSKNKDSVLAFVPQDAQIGLPLFSYGNSMSQEELDERDRKRKATGRRGEKLIDAYFESLITKGIIKYHTWYNDKDREAQFPFDFIYIDHACTTWVEVKSTGGDFATSVDISIRQIEKMAREERYNLYRVYELDEKELKGKLRVAKGMRSFAQRIVDSLTNLPAGVKVDSFSVDPKQIESFFCEPLALSFSEGKE